MPGSALLKAVRIPLLAQALGLLFSTSLLAADAIPSLNTVQTKHLLTDAAKLQITNRGLGLFKDHLQTVLANQGISVDEAYFDGVHWQSKNPIDLDSAGLDAKTRNMVSTVTSTLHDWLTGFPLLTKVQPVIDIGASGYKAKINKLGISTDDKLIQQLAQKDGVVLVLDAEIQEIDVQATQIRIWDRLDEKTDAQGQELPVLGKVGLDRPYLKIGGGATPLVIRMPFLVQIDAQGLPTFTAIGFEQNINQVDLELSYGNIVTPDIEVVVNGVPYKLDQATLDKNLQKQMPTILEKIRGQLHDLASQQIPDLLNKLAKEKLVNTLEQVQTLEAPGADKNDRPLLWGLKLDKSSENNDFELSLSTYIEDPLNPDSELKVTRAPRPALMQSYAQQNYDIAFALDQGIINRMLQLSFERRLFSAISLASNTAEKPGCGPANPPPVDPRAPPQILEILEAPQLLAQQNGGSTGTDDETLVRVHAKVKVPQGSVTGTDTLFLHDQFPLTGDLIVKLKASSDRTKIQMFLWDIDPASVKIDSSALTTLGSLMSSKITNKVKGQLTDLVKDWRCNETTLPGTVQIPATLGIDLTLQHLEMETTGNLVLYLQYSAAAVGGGK